MEIHINPKLEEHLHMMAAQYGQSEDMMVEKALKEYLEDMEDISAAEKALANSNGRTWTQDEVEREFGITYPASVSSS